jgi:hypothetical protein
VNVNLKSLIARKIDEWVEMIGDWIQISNCGNFQRELS